MNFVQFCALRRVGVHVCRLGVLLLSAAAVAACAGEADGPRATGMDGGIAVAGSSLSIDDNCNGLIDDDCNLFANPRFETGIAGVSAVKVVGTTQAAAPEFIAWDQNPGNGTAGALRITSMRLAQPTALHHTGAILGFSPQIPEPSWIELSFRAKSVSGGTLMSAIRTWGGSTPVRFRLTSEWASYKGYLQLSQGTGSLILNLVGQDTNVQQDTVDGVFLIDDVQIRFVPPCTAASCGNYSPDAIFGSSLREVWDTAALVAVDTNVQGNWQVVTWTGARNGTVLSSATPNRLYLAGQDPALKGAHVALSNRTGPRYASAAFAQDLVASGALPYFAFVHDPTTKLIQPGSSGRFLEVRGRADGTGPVLSVVAEPGPSGMGVIKATYAPDAATPTVYSTIDAPQVIAGMLTEVWLAADGLHFAQNGLEYPIVAAASAALPQSLRNITLGNGLGGTLGVDSRYAQVVVSSSTPTQAQRAAYQQYVHDKFGIAIDSCSAATDCDANCGNGVLDPGEECDDGNAVANDSCNNDCTLGATTREPETILGGTLVDWWDSRYGRKIVDGGVESWTGQKRGLTVRAVGARPYYAPDGTFFGGQSVVQTTIAGPRWLYAGFNEDIVAAGSRPYIAALYRERTPLNVNDVRRIVDVSSAGTNPSMLALYESRNSNDSRTTGTYSPLGPTGGVHYSDGLGDPSDTPVLSEVWIAADGLHYAKNGVERPVAGAGNAALGNALTRLAFGFEPTVPSQFNDVSFAQVAIASAVPTVQQRAAYLGYLRSAWGVQFCGDGTVASTEQCDDGNTASGDGCSSTCTIEVTPTTTAALLDVTSAPVAAYSVALKLRSAYAGAALRVRRASDNAQQDIGFSSGNRVDVAAISTFCGTSDCFVTSLYDQSSNNRTLTQTTAGNQFRIYLGATRTVAQSDGQPVLTTEGTTKFLISAATGNGLSASGGMTWAYRGRVASTPAMFAETQHLDGWTSTLSFNRSDTAELVLSLDSGAVYAPTAVGNTHTGVVLRDAAQTVLQTVVRVNGTPLSYVNAVNGNSVPRLGEQTLLLGNSGRLGASGATEISSFVLWGAKLPAEDVEVVEIGLDGSLDPTCAANAPCSADCPCDTGRLCTSDLQCARDLVCRTDVASRFGLANGTGVCWDNRCDDQSSPQFQCGATNSLCGLCPTGCAPQCNGLSCGYDECFGSCGNTCVAGQFGCDTHSQCSTGACAIDHDGESQCVLDICEHPGLNPCSNPANAGRDLGCGTCPACVPDCGARVCGLSPNGCGSCDTASLNPAVQFCTATGRIFPRVTKVATDEAIVDLPSVPGTLPGALSVSDDGQATYTIPLQVAPGRQGMQPDLALTYSSDASNGYAGMGWGITGLSAIQRCPKTFAQDGKVAPITYTNEDRFCLDGQRLVLDTGSPAYGSNGARYRTEVDSFARIDSTADAIEPRTFTVYTREGRILTYDLRIGGRGPRLDGVHAPDSDTERAGSRTQTWLLTQVRDRFGNAMRISYNIENPNGGGNKGSFKGLFGIDFSILAQLGATTREYYPDTIEYTSNVDDNGNVRLDGNRRVKFNYRDRRDLLGAHQAGVHYERTKLLESIENTVEGQLAFRYALTYTEPVAGADGRARPDQLHVRSTLSSVQQCTRNATESATTTSESCKPPTTFTYSNVTPGLMPEAATDIGPQFFGPDYEDADFAGPPLTLDMDGNGQDDVLYSQCTQDHTVDGKVVCDWAWRLQLNGAMLAATQYETGPDANLRTKSTYRYLEPVTLSKLFVVDYDLDGRDDVLEIDSAYRRGLGGGIRKWSLVNGRLIKEDLPISIGPPVRGGDIYVLDANGDGAADLLRCTPVYDTGREVANRKVVDNVWDLRLHVTNAGAGTTSGFGSATTLTGIHVPCREASVVDVDGDGADELLLNSTPFLAPQKGAHPVAGKTNDASAVLWPLTRIVTETALPAGRGDQVRLLFDADGDGLRDVVQINAGFEVTLWINTGRGFVSHNQTLSSPECTMDSASLRQLNRSVPFDIDGDGRGDLVLLCDGKWFVMRSLGRSFELSRLRDRDGANTGFAFYPTVVRANNDEVPDLIDVAYSVAHHRQGGAVPRLIGVTNGLGGRGAVEYDRAPYAGGTTYNKSSSTGCGYPTYCPAPRKALVRALTALQPLPSNAALRTFTQRYENFAVSLQGRGALGFQRRVIEDSARSLAAADAKHSLTLIYANKYRERVLGTYPYAGRVQVSIDRARTLSNRWQQSAVSRTWALDETIRYSTPQSVFPWLMSEARATVETDLANQNGKTLSAVQITWDYDDYGNEKASESTWGSGDVQRRITTYVNDTDHIGRWLVSLPRTRTISGTGSSPVQRVEQFRYAEDPGAEGGIPYSGAVERITLEPGHPDLEHHTRFVHNQYGNVETVVEIGKTADTGGTQTRISSIHYDGMQMFPDSQTDPKTHTVKLQYDQALGLLQRSEETPRSGTTLVMEWITDGFGRLRRTQNQDGTKTTLTYTTPAAANGAMAVSVSAPGTPSETTFYDVLGREISRQVAGFSGTMARTIEYNALDLPRAFSRPYDSTRGDGDITTVDYDPQGRAVLYDLPDTRSVERCYYDNVACTRDARKFTSCEVQDERGRLAYSVQPLENATLTCGSVALDVANHFPPFGAPLASAYKTTRYQYDPFGALVSTTDAEGVVTRREVDSYGRLRRLIDPDAGTWNYTYTSYGEPRTEVDPQSRTAIYRYDLLGRPDTRTDVATATEIQQVTKWEYDTNYYGELNKTTSPDGITTTLTYDAQGRIDIFSRVIPSSIGPQTLSRDDDYDTSGRLSNQRYTSANSATPMQLAYRYTLNGYLDRVSKPGTTPLNYWTKLTTSAYDELLTESFGNQAVTTRSYFADKGFLDALSTARNGTTIQSWRHTYDDNGNLLIRRNAMSGATAQTRYDYDAMERLKFAGLYPNATSTTPQYREDYGYSDSGNIKTKSVWGSTVTPRRDWTYEYLPSRPHAVSVISNGTTLQNYGYSASGNLQTRSAGGTGMTGSLVVSYNRAQRPVTVGTTATSTNTITFNYDADGYRVRKATSSSSTGNETLYLDDFYSRTRRQGTSGFVENLVVDAGDHSVAEVSRATNGAETVLYLHEDMLGSVELVTNSLGGLAEQREYEAFGKRRKLTGPGATTRGDFTGHELDTEFGLINAKARLYDPAIGRFLSPDPIASSSRFGQSLNPYSYVANSPTRFADPLGLDIQEVGPSDGSGIAVKTDGIEGGIKGVVDFFDYVGQGIGRGLEAIGDYLGGPSPDGIAPGAAMPSGAGIPGSGPLVPLGPPIDGDSGRTATTERSSSAAPSGNTPMTYDEFAGRWNRMVDAVDKAMNPLGNRNGGGGVLAGMWDFKLPSSGELIASIAVAAVLRGGGKALGDVASRAATRIGRRWMARSITNAACRTGCERVAAQIQKHIGGDVKRIVPTDPRATNLGAYRGTNPGWAHHEVVVKGDRVYDAFTGHEGATISEYKALWEHADAINFGF